MEDLKTSVPGEWGKVLQNTINFHSLMNRSRLCLSKCNLHIHAHWFQEQSTESWNFRNWKSITGFKVWPKKDVPLEFRDQPTHASLALLEASKTSQHFPGVSGMGGFAVDKEKGHQWEKGWLGSSLPGEWYHGPFYHGRCVSKLAQPEMISFLFVLSAVKAEVELISFLACHETTPSALPMLVLLLEIPSIFHGRKVHDITPQPVNFPVSSPFSLIAFLLANSKPTHANPPMPLTPGSVGWSFKLPARQAKIWVGWSQNSNGTSF